LKTLKVGIASYEEMKARTMAIARRERRRRRGEPRIWFRSVESFAKVLSERNRALLALIAEATRRFILQADSTPAVRQAWAGVPSDWKSLRTVGSPRRTPKQDIEIAKRRLKQMREK